MSRKGPGATFSRHAPATRHVDRARLLWVLHHQGPSPQRVLAEALRVSPRNVTGLAHVLAKLNEALGR